MKASNLREFCFDNAKAEIDEINRKLRETMKTGKMTLLLDSLSEAAYEFYIKEGYVIEKIEIPQIPITNYVLKW